VRSFFLQFWFLVFDLDVLVAHLVGEGANDPVGPHGPHDRDRGFGEDLLRDGVAARGFVVLRSVELLDLRGQATHDMGRRAGDITVQHAGQEQQAGVALVERQRWPLERRERALAQRIVKGRPSQFAFHFIFGEGGLLEPPGGQGERQLPGVELGFTRRAIGFSQGPLEELRFSETSESGDWRGRTATDATACQDAILDDQLACQSGLATAAKDHALPE